MLPQYQRLDAVRDAYSPVARRWHVPFPYVSAVTVSMPLFAFAFCVVWSVLFEFERSTTTHCNVPNLLPSISAAIGNYQPQRFVWQAAILLAVGPRLWITSNYVLLYGRSIRRSRLVLAYTACLLNAAENVALVGLSLFTSSDDYEMHKTCFMIFIATSECYMALSYVVNKAGRKLADPIAQRSLRYKRNLCLLNIASFALAGYFFVRHNDRCEPLMYTWFACAEYAVVLTNMAFHTTAAFDFHDQSVLFDWTNGVHMAPSSYVRI